MSGEHISISHSDAEARDQERRAEAQRAQQEIQRRARDRIVRRLQDELPHVWARGSVSVDQFGSIHESFSGAGATPCDCGKPDFSHVPDGPIVFTNTPPASSAFTGSPAGPQRGGRPNPTAQALASRVDRARFASSKSKLIVVFDGSGQMLGTADPSKVQQPDAKTVIVFDQSGQPLGLIPKANITAVAQPVQPQAPQQPAAPAAPAAPAQAQQPAQQIGGQLRSGYRR